MPTPPTGVIEGLDQTMRSTVPICVQTGPQSGFTILEVLVALIIILLGLLGLAGLQARAQQAEVESYQRAQALVVLQDIVDRINANRATAPCFAVTTSSGKPYLGSTGADHVGTVSCTATGTAADAPATQSIDALDAALQGVAEATSAGNVGAMTGARACIALDPGAVAPPTPDTYTVAVAWQGMTDTVAPSVPAGSSTGLANAVACGTNLYGAETKRRVIWTTLSIGRLN
jgi:type IV pilus assembly protein PilV